MAARSRRPAQLLPSLKYLELLRAWNRDEFAWRFELLDVADKALRKHRAPRSAQDLYMILIRSRLKIGPRISIRRADLGAAIGKCDRTAQRSMAWLQDRGLIAISRDGSGEILRIATPFKRLRAMLAVPQEPKKIRKHRSCGQLSPLSPIPPVRETFLSPSHPLVLYHGIPPAAPVRRLTDLGTTRSQQLLPAGPQAPQDTATAPRTGSAGLRPASELLRGVLGPLGPPG